VIGREFLVISFLVPPKSLLTLNEEATNNARSVARITLPAIRGRIEVSNGVGHSTDRVKEEVLLLLRQVSFI
jgi:hypothetical protein